MVTTTILHKECIKHYSTSAYSASLFGKGGLKSPTQASSKLQPLWSNERGTWKKKKKNSKNKLCQPPVGAATEGLEGNSQCCYCNGTLKYTEEGHVKFDRKAWAFDKETGKHETFQARRDSFGWIKGPGGKRKEVAK